MSTATLAQPTTVPAFTLPLPRKPLSERIWDRRVNTKLLDEVEKCYMERTVQLIEQVEADLKEMRATSTSIAIDGHPTVGTSPATSTTQEQYQPRHRNTWRHGTRRPVGLNSTNSNCELEHARRVRHQQRADAVQLRDRTIVRLALTG